MKPPQIIVSIFVLLVVLSSLSCGSKAKHDNSRRKVSTNQLKELQIAYLRQISRMDTGLISVDSTIQTFDSIALNILSDTSTEAAAQPAPIPFQGFLIRTKNISDLFNNNQSATYALIFMGMDPSNKFCYEILPGTIAIGAAPTLSITQNPTYITLQNSDGICPKDCDASFVLSAATIAQALAMPTPADKTNANTMITAFYGLLPPGSGVNVIAISKNQFNTLAVKDPYLQISFAFDFANNAVGVTWTGVTATNFLDLASPQQTFWNNTLFNSNAQIQ
jgi:hypothetical protein